MIVDLRYRQEKHLPTLNDHVRIDLDTGASFCKPHKVSVLSTCKLPDTVHGLRSFIGAYKMLSRVLPSCAPLEIAVSGLQSRDKIKWSEELIENFNTAQ